MNTQSVTATPRPESRIGPAVTVLALAVVLAFLPARYQVAVPWLQRLLFGMLLLPLVMAHRARVGSPWTVVERYGVALLAIVGVVSQAALLGRMINEIIQHPKAVNPIALLATSVAVWVSIVVGFSLGYWLLDRGGPDRRSSGFSGRSDLAFPVGEAADRLPDDWQPVYADYLFVAFNTSSAFSPTDTAPLTIRMKMLMMTQSAMSLLTIVVIAARAINILGS